MPEQTFFLDTPRDVLDMLEFQLDLVKSAPLDRPNDYGYLVIQCAVTAWQLCDWVFAGIPIETQASFQVSGPRTALGRFQNWIQGDCLALDLCRVIADAFKHRTITRTPRPDVQTIHFEVTQKNGKVTMLHAVVSGSAKLHDPTKILTDAHDYWLHFLSRMNLLARSPGSRRFHEDSPVAATIRQELERR